MLCFTPVQPDKAMRYLQAWLALVACSWANYLNKEPARLKRLCALCHHVLAVAVNGGRERALGHLRCSKVPPQCCQALLRCVSGRGFNKEWRCCLICRHAEG